MLLTRGWAWWCIGRVDAFRQWDSNLQPSGWKAQNPTTESPCPSSSWIPPIRLTGLSESGQMWWCRLHFKWTSFGSFYVEPPDIFISISVLLLVLEPFPTVKEPKIHQRPVGSSLTLNCHPPHSYPTGSIYWGKNRNSSKLLSIENTERVSQDYAGKCCSLARDLSE